MTGSARQGAPAPARTPPFALLFAVVTVGPSTANMFVSSLPSVQRAMDTTYATAQLTLSVYMLCFALALLVYGPLSDRYGRRPVVLASLWIYLAATLCCLVAPTIHWLIAARGLQAVGGCAGFSLARAMVRDVYGRERSAGVIAYLSMAMALGPMVSPAIGGYLDLWFGWRANFVFLLAAGATILAFAQVFLHETRPGTPQAGMIADLLASIGRLITMRRYLGYTLQIACTSSIFWVFVSTMPLVMKEYLHRPTNEYGLYFMILPTMFMSGSFIAGRCAGRVAVDTMIWIGSAVVVAGTALACAAVWSGWIVPAILFGSAGVITLGAGITQANSLAGAVSVDPRIAGAAAGLAGSLQTGSNGLSSFVAGSIVSGPPEPVVVLMAVGAAGAVLMHFIGSRGARDPG